MTCELPYIDGFKGSLYHIPHASHGWSSLATQRNNPTLREKLLPMNGLSIALYEIVSAETYIPWLYATSPWIPVSKALCWDCKYQWVVINHLLLGYYIPILMGTQIIIHRRDVIIVRKLCMGWVYQRHQSRIAPKRESVSLSAAGHDHRRRRWSPFRFGWFSSCFILYHYR